MTPEELAAIEAGIIHSNPAMAWEDMLAAAPKPGETP